MAEEQIDPTRARDIIRFQIFYNQRKIKSTWALAIIIVGVYLLEEFFGGSQNVAVLVRMGANVNERVLAGEYYRLFSSVFLHAGFLHVFFNTYVLFALGGFFNRILGEARYLTVFFISGIAGSLASVFFGKANISVGASGAIWGLFGASLALAFFKTTLLPEAIRVQLRRVTLINLVINIGISFLPMIDFWAHIGGGIAGFLVSLAIILPSQKPALDRFFTYAFRFIATVLALSYAASLVYAMYAWKPWEDPLKLTLSLRNLPEVAFSLGIPEGLKQKSGPNNSVSNAYYLFGDLKTDRLVIEVHFFREDMLGAKPNKAWLAAQRDNLLTDGSVPSEVKKSVFLLDETEEALLYYQQPNKDADVTIHNYVVTRDDYAVRITLVTSSKIEQARIDEMAKKIILSIANVK